MKEIASSVAIAAAGFAALFGLYAAFGALAKRPLPDCIGRRGGIALPAVRPARLRTGRFPVSDADSA